jgi:hypothetical protein
MQEQPVWTETDSRDFLDLTEIAVPARDEQTRALLDLIPADPGEAIAVVDICAGEGVLCEAILQAYPNSRVTALDCSELMRGRAASRLAKYGDRGAVVAFNLDSDDWTEELPSPPRCPAPPGKGAQAISLQKVGRAPRVRRGNSGRRHHRHIFAVCAPVIRVTMG